MTGTLTPLPHTPLSVELKEQGRLLDADLACNNVDDTVQFKPVMGLENFQSGFLHILESLFSTRAMYGRAEHLLSRLDMHIFSHSTLNMNSALWQGQRRFTGRLTLSHGDRAIRLVTQAEYSSAL